MTDEEKEHRLLCANIREVLKTGAGKKFLWEILSRCNLYSESFTGNSQTFFLEGKRSVGLEILQLLEDADPTAYANLLLDNQKIKEGKS